MRLRRPVHGADPALPATLDLTLVDVRETTPPADGKPVHWRLLTTHAVGEVGEARRIIALYRQRWTIEEFFRTLKTAGFDIEAADIAEPQAMINLVAAAAIAAVTVKQLVQARDGDTRQRLADAFEPDDAPVLEAVSAKLEGKTQRQRNPHPKGSLAFAAWVIARLGGWTGYYGKPGPKVMRIGLTEFNAIKYGFTLSLQNALIHSACGGGFGKGVPLADRRSAWLMPRARTTNESDDQRAPPPAFPPPLRGGSRRWPPVHADRFTHHRYADLGNGLTSASARASPVRPHGLRCAAGR